MNIRVFEPQHVAKVVFEVDGADGGEGASWEKGGGEEIGGKGAEVKYSGSV